MDTTIVIYMNKQLQEFKRDGIVWFRYHKVWLPIDTWNHYRGLIGQKPIRILDILVTSRDGNFESSLCDIVRFGMVAETYQSCPDGIRSTQYVDSKIREEFRDFTKTLHDNGVISRDDYRITMSIPHTEYDRQSR